ncbi:hypothetical protein [Maribacter antarcticus]|uniref:hypothetical protein n=1 Tax=Maribacter antarcticus TaxID=505250 RepID=UPI00047D9E91|nr:hypothetical protein [Maribacter antarcticus]
MNKIEKLVYDAVKKNQHLKAGIRNIYQTVFDLLPNKKNYSKNPIQAKEGFFFGFHDVCPFSYDDSKLLGNQLTIPFRMNTAEDVLHVGYFDHKNGELGDYIQIGETHAWNYHKGCRLQWVGKDKLIYNAVVDEKQLVSKIFDIETQQETVIPFPIDHVSHDGIYASTFNYGRLERYMLGYGYAGITEEGHYNTEKMPEQTGLFLGNLKTGEKELLISLRELTKVGEMSSGFENCFHYVTHSLFSSDNRYISFLHRWVDEFDTFNRHSRLVSYDRQEKKCYIAPTNDMVSHYVWNNQNQIVAYCRIGDIDCHVLFKEPTLQDYQIVAYPQLNSDGHQSFITSSSFVTDTYPNRSRMANLYKVDATTNAVEHLASLKSFKKFQSQAFKHWSCDFHPRMNRNSDVVCFDSVHTGQRALCVMKIT